MKFNNGLLVSAALVMCCDLARAGDLRAIIEGVKSSSGHVLCAIYGSENGFPKDRQRAVQLVSVAADTAGVSCVFPSLPAGTYALSVFHDENDDGVLNTNFAGVPREGYGFSNNHVYAMHAATFQESGFTVEAQAPAEIHVRLKY
jgi:uncharacterized protein (DUF2141 family)